MSDESELRDAADQADALRSRLVDDAQRIRWHDEVLQKDDACRWGGVDTLSWQMDVDRAADLMGVLAPAARRLADLLDAVQEVVTELDLEHSKDGDLPWCRICGVDDGSWPCVTALNVESLRDAVAAARKGGE